MGYHELILKLLLATTAATTWVVMEQSWLVVAGWLISELLETCSVRARNNDIM